MNRLATFAALKNYQLWDIAIGNNYYDGRYPNYRYRDYPVIAGSAAEAREVVLKYSNEILAHLKTKKYNDKKKMLPPRSALPITEWRVSHAHQRIIRSTAQDRWKAVISPEGWIEVQLKYSHIVNWRKCHETGNT